MTKSSTLTRCIRKDVPIVPADRHQQERDSMLLVQKNGPVVTSFQPVSGASLSFSGSNQAREGRLVNALAVRGDERRDTLR